MKPIAGKNQSPFGLNGVQIQSAKDSAGNVLSDVRILRQCSAHCFDLQSKDGLVVYNKIKLVSGANGVPFAASATAASISALLKAGEFAFPVLDGTSGSVKGYAQKLTLHRVVLGDGTLSYVSDIDYTANAVTGVQFITAPRTVAVAGTFTLQYNVLPANATNKAVTFSSSDNTKATVNAAGLVTGVAAGTATMTVTTVDGAKVATVLITVA